MRKYKSSGWFTLELFHVFRKCSSFPHHLLRNVYSTTSVNNPERGNVCRILFDIGIFEDFDRGFVDFWTIKGINDKKQVYIHAYDRLENSAHLERSNSRNLTFDNSQKFHVLRKNNLLRHVYPLRHWLINCSTSISERWELKIWVTVSFNFISWTHKQYGLYMVCSFRIQN